MVLAVMDAGKIIHIYSPEDKNTPISLRTDQETHTAVAQD